VLQYVVGVNHDQTYEDDHRARNVSHDQTNVVCRHDHYAVLHEEHHDQTYEGDHHGRHEVDANHDQICEEDGRLPHENLREVYVKNRRDENRQSDVGLTLYRGGLSCLDVQT
jgi:hypothetical protein